MKILISSIGTGGKKHDGPTRYAGCNYKINEKVYKDERFVARSLIKHYSIDQLFLFGTKESMWDEVYAQFAEGSDDEFSLNLMEKIDRGEGLSIDDLTKIENAIDSKLKTKGSRCFVIEYGKTYDELWHNFSKYLSLSDMIPDKASIYIDITHSFRSLSLMQYLMVDFLREVRSRSFHVEDIFYGMYDGTQKGGDVPVVSLGTCYQLSRWTQALSIFKRYGDVDELIELIENDKIASRSFVQILKSLKRNLAMGNLQGLQNSYLEIIESKLEVEHPLLRLIWPDLKNTAKDLYHPKRWVFLSKMASWYYSKGIVSLAYLALSEAIDWYVASKLGFNEITRETKKDIAVHVEKAFGQKLADDIKRVRNNIAHQIMDREYLVAEDIEEFSTFLNRFKRETGLNY